MAAVIKAVVFDMDGVLVDTEQVWDEVREQLAAEWGGTYTAEAQRAMMGMSSGEWSRYMHEAVGLEKSADEINAEVVRRMLHRYRLELPVVRGAVESVRRLREAGLALAVASSSNRPLIDTVLRTIGVSDEFAATVSSEEVHRGKPAPDVYVEAAHRLGVDAAECAAVEDSENGIRSAHAAGMRVLALPNEHYPPSPDVLRLVAVVLRSHDDLTVAAASGRGGAS
jgi:HAD superfamily hydrolase (TIGR01509 family)